MNWMHSIPWVLEHHIWWIFWKFSQFFFFFLFANFCEQLGAYIKKFIKLQFWWNTCFNLTTKGMSLLASVFQGNITYCPQSLGSFLGFWRVIYLTIWQAVPMTRDCSWNSPENTNSEHDGYKNFVFVLTFKTIFVHITQHVLNLYFSELLTQIYLFQYINVW